MLLSQHGFKDVQDLTESHAMAIINSLAGIKTSVKKQANSAEFNAQEVTSTRHVATRRRTPKETP